MRSDWNGQDLLNYLEKGKAKSLPYNDDLESDKGWVTTWGNTIFEEDRMILKTDDGSNGASVYLDGTYNWKDYAFSADIGINQSESISMIGAYQDRNTYYSCDFSEGYISLRHKFGGTITKLVEIPNSSRIERVGIAFKEGKLWCLLNDTTVISVDGMDINSLKGGVAIQAWDSQVDNVNVSIEQVQVMD